MVRICPKLRNQSEEHLKDRLLQCVEGAMMKVLISKLGTDILGEITSSQLLSEIERVLVQTQLDLLNKIKLFKAAQGPIEPIKNFVFRLQLLAYECNLTTSCSSQDCTAANYGGNILFAMVRGLANDDIKEEILSKLDLISLEDAIKIVSKKESEVTEAYNISPRNGWFQKYTRKIEEGSEGGH